MDPPTSTLLQNEGTSNNLKLAPTTNALLQKEVVLNTETLPPPNMTIPQNEGISQHDVSPPEAQTNIAINLASELVSKLSPPTFEQILKSIKQGVKLTMDLNFHPETAKLQHGFIEKNQGQNVSLSLF